MNQETTPEDVKLMRKILHRMEKFNRGFKTALIVWIILPLVLVAGLVVMYGLEKNVAKMCASSKIEKLTVEQVNAVMEAKAQLTVLRSQSQRDGLLFSGVLGFSLVMPLALWLRCQSNRVMICLVRAHLRNLEAASNGKADPIPHDQARPELSAE
jgi:hypothetical protein